jgi:hypothetical protein
MLLTNVPQIVKSLMNQPSADYKDAYFQFGHFICSLLFNTSTILDTNISFYSLKPNLNESCLFFVYNNELIDKEQQGLISKYNNQKFILNESKILQSAGEDLVKLCIQYVTAIVNFDKEFDLQYVSFIILKRLYFIFPNMRSSIADLLAFTLVNICLFNDRAYLENSEDCRNFIAYLQTFDTSDIKEKLNKRIQAKKANVDQLKPKSNNECK